MKNQKGITPVIAIIILVMTTLVVVAMIFEWFKTLPKPEPTYTQSEVSALMKFNASEFGCSYNHMDVGKVLNDQLVINCFPSGVFNYFPQFDGVSVVVEPERQECLNITILTYGECTKWGEVSCSPSGGCGAGCLEVIIEKRNETKCQTIPAKEKVLSGWAVDESDLATEFCSAKSYETKNKVCVEYGEQECFLFVNSVGGGCNAVPCLKYSNETKPFTRGEVVVKKTTYPLGWGYYTKKQKVIRCSDGGYSEDFGDVLK